MRIPAVIAAIALMALCIPGQNAQAQGMGQRMGKGQQHSDSTGPKFDKAPKADEKAYKDALKAIPVKKTDPWEKMR